MSYVRLSDLAPLAAPRTVFVPRVPGLLPYTERPGVHTLSQGDLETIRAVGRLTAKRTGAQWVTFPGGLFYTVARDDVMIV